MKGERFADARSRAGVYHNIRLKKNFFYKKKINKAERGDRNKTSYI